MKKNYKLLISLGLLLLMTLSCNESFLDIKPFGSVSETTLANEAGIDKMLIGTYSLVNGGGARGGDFRIGINYIRGGADDSRMGTETGASEYDACLFSSSDGYIHQAWQFWFAAVGRANDVLKMIPKVEDSTPEHLLQVEAEAKFLRGYFYTYLVMFFRNVPWIDESINYGEGNYYVPNTMDVYPEIEADFMFAASNLTETKSEVGRANKWAAKAILAKTYMFQERFAAAKPLLDDIIANGQTTNGLKYKLLDKYNDNFIAATKNGSEAVFVMENSVKDGTNGNNGNPLNHYDGTYGGPATCCYGWNQPTYDYVDACQTDPETGLPLLDTYRDTPIPHDNGISSSSPFTPYQGTLDSRLDWCVGRRGIPYRDWGVHPGQAWVRNQFTSGPYNVVKNIAEQARVESDRASGGGYTNNPYNVIRFADIILWAAECEVEIGSLQKAEDYVNTVRQRAANPEGFVHKYINPAEPLAGFTDEPAANYKIGLYTGQFTASGKNYARKAVRFERRMELGQEHHRMFDLIRYDGNDFDVAAYMNAFYAVEGPRLSNKTNNYLTAVFGRDHHEYLPIPLAQIDLSVSPEGESVLVQNPGY